MTKLKNARAKGGRRELLCQHQLEQAGYLCTKAAASLGVFDIVASNRLGTRYIQVKSNCWPRPAEREEMARAKLNLPENSTAECWRYNDNNTTPMIRHLDEF